MRFKSIQMRGFKSFVDDTKLEFDKGITAVVGPNGCGKSNIADAIRWVLGEQSAKILRGAKMEDFIFNGSQTRKATGLAEVSITLSETEGSISSHAFAEYEEITVTRKLFRTGESEYLINKVPCRLKDVVDVFLDTGLSTKSLSIIEQGQVSKLVNSKPEDRRILIEEAAGVMKYKSRRNAALNKLAGAQQNLLRIQDILGELEKQRNSLKRQAKKAERFQSFRNEITQRGLAVYSHQYQELAEKLGKTELELNLSKEEETALSARLSARKNQLVTISTEITKEERALTELKEERNRINSSIERNESHVALLEDQISELASSNKRAGEEIAELERKIEEGGNTVAGNGEKAVSLEEEIAGNKKLKEQLLAEAKGVRERISARRERDREISKEEESVSRKISEKGNRSSWLKARIDMAASRVESVSGQEKEIEEVLSVLAPEIERLKNEVVTGGEKLESAKIEEDTARTELASVTTKLAESREELRGANDKVTRLSSRLESLQELDRNLEGFGEGVRRLMKLKEEGAVNVSGLLADKLKIPQGLEKALAGVLGDRLEAVITDQSGSALSAVKLLREGKSGGAGFLSHDLLPKNGVSYDPGDSPSLVGRASDLLELADDAPAGARSLLSRVFVAKDLAGGLDIWNNDPGTFTVVTLEGDVIDTSGFITGGESEGSASKGAMVLTRKRTIEELLVQVGEESAKRDELKKAADQLSEMTESARIRLEDGKTAMRRIEMDLFERKKELQKEESDLFRGEKRLEELKRERERIVEEKSVFVEEEGSISSELESLTESKREMERSKIASAEEMEVLTASLESVSSRLNEEEVRLTSAQARLDHVKHEIRRAESETTDLQNRVRRLKESIVDFGTRTEDMKKSINSLRDENGKFAREIDRLSHDITRLTESLEERVDQRTAMEEESAGLDTKVDSSRSIVSNLSVTRSELTVRIDGVIEKADHEFNIPVEDLAKEDVSEIDIAEATQRLGYLRGELSRIGDVNMSALTEFEEVEQRFEHMKEQHEDLVTSIVNLRKTIDSVNSVTRKLFNEAYKEVSANFEMLFSRLFGGGRAEMRLVQEEGKPEEGIEIFVQPPGKKVQNLNLLSAGEKAMTAIALLFAVFLKQPSPFCLLDEVDAPLDEANIVRFRDLLMEMREKIQFIIITHNQKTMGFAERLYGVTQEEKGVSKILAVDLVDHRHNDFTLTAA